ncbi:tripartite tricarboxylate transporter substrate binding protein [Pseudorhodoferax sp. LjRoot39]|uniref:Bug family tripartite tricarboxylate transporter substrate binding protein n=1 Tax=Pseudorhodoferax sp. LjRoot39 TaxID=3342328 RepID=UPI003ECE4E73
MRRRTALQSLAALAAAPTFAQSPYPNKPVRLIVPYPPGGTTDLLARLVAAGLGEKLGQSFTVDNRAGASGAIGSLAVAKAPADGYTLVMATISSHGINSALNKTLPYDPVADFAPITCVASTPNVITVNAALPVKTLPELLAMARAQPGKLSFGSTSAGGSPHMSVELLKMMAGVDMVHIPYKGGGPMLTDLIGGQIPVGVDNLPSSMAHIQSGRIRALAVTTAQRWPGTPDIPTVAESGVPGYEAGAWFGLLAPAGTPQPIVEQLQQAVAELLRRPASAQRLSDMGAAPVANTPDAFGRQIAAEIAKWKKVVAATGVKVE